MNCGRCSLGSRNQRSTCSARAASGTFAFKEIEGRAPPIVASDPGQDRHAARIPCRSAKTHNGTPPYQLLSALAAGSVELYRRTPS